MGAETTLFPMTGFCAMPGITHLPGPDPGVPFAVIINPFAQAEILGKIGRGAPRFGILTATDIIRLAVVIKSRPDMQHHTGTITRCKDFLMVTAVQRMGVIQMFFYLGKLKSGGRLHRRHSILKIRRYGHRRQNPQQRHGDQKLHQRKSFGGKNRRAGFKRLLKFPPFCHKIPH